LNSEIKINSNSSTSIQSITNFVDDKNPQKTDSLQLQSIDGGLESNQNNLNISFNLKSKKIKVKNKTKGDLNIKVASIKGLDSVDTVKNKIVYTGKNSHADAIIESVDGGVKQTIKIKSSSSPSYYDFPMELTKDERIILNLDGSGKVVKTDGSNKMVILKPWAKDANNKDLKTWYEIIDNSTIRQRIDLNKAAFPVVADPIWCGKSYFKLEWENRPSEGGWSLKVSPTWCGRQIGINYFEAWETFKDVAWDAPWHADFDWYNKASQNNTNKYWSMFKQYHCHSIVGPWKETWNLEPKRPNYTWRTFMNPRIIDGKPIPGNPE
jgi:Protein of unknown function (DUF2599)